jgi:outer membrane protein assembly factor BamB
LDTSAGDARDGTAGDATADSTADSSVPDVGPPDTSPMDTGVPDAIVVGDASCALVQPTGSTAVAYQIDPAHTGQQPGDALSLPFCQRWSTDVGGFASYPLVFGGRVFVTVAGGGGFKSALYALDQHTGAILWGPIDLGGSFPWSNAVYDAGQVFVVNSDGVLAAFAATTGTKNWQVTLPDVSQAPPTALAGFVYVSVHGTVSAVTEAAGVVAWSAPVQDGDESSPALSPAGAYVSYACNQAYDFSPASGALIWHAAGPCSGGGGKTVSLFGGEVYTRDDTDLILNAVTGAQVGTYSSMFIPAFSAGTGYYTPDYKVVATTLATGTPVWTFSSDQIITAPLVVGSHVVVGSLAGTLYALSVADGTVASSVSLPEILGPDEQNVSAPLAGMTAADGMLFVPAGTAVVAF